MAASYCFGAKELTIEEAINFAMLHSPDIKISQAEFLGQKNKEVSAWLDLGPRLSLSYKDVFYDKKLTVPSNGSELLMRDDRAKMGSITLTQPLSDLFALVQRGRYENRQKDLKATSLKLTSSQVAFKTAELYLRAQQSDRMWQISQASIDASLAQKKDGESLLKVDRIHKGEFLKLELALSSARANEAKARAAKDIALFSLLESIGADKQESYTLSPLKPETISLASLPSLDEGLSRAINDRLEIKQAIQGENIASIAQQGPLAKFFPSVNFFMQVERNFGQIGFGASRDTKMLGFNFSWEFFNSGSSIFSYREATQNVAKAYFQRTNANRMVRIDYMQARANLIAANEGLAFAEKALEQADEAYRIEKLQFSLGKTQASQLVLAETAKTQAAGNLVTFLTDLKIQNLKLQQALGELRPKL